jgi:5-methyltetrahydropteroyltriglutamate--homocysteine methyltransferase
MQTTTPPFRADMVGSLLRTAPLKDARAKREKGTITPAQLKSVEDEEIRKIIRKQEEVGLQLATDGEFRRSWWHFDFFWHLTGCERVVLDHGIQFHGIQTKPESLKVTGKLDFPADHPMLEHFKFVRPTPRSRRR